MKAIKKGIIGQNCTDHRVPEFLAHYLNWLPPTPFPASECFPTQDPRGGGGDTYSLVVRGWGGGANSDEGTNSKHYGICILIPSLCKDNTISLAQ